MAFGKTLYHQSVIHPIGAPMELKVNGEMRDTVVSSLYDLITDMGLEPTRVAAELNGNIVPRSEFKNTVLKNGDSLEIVNFVGGG